MPYVPGVVAVIGDVHGCMDELKTLMEVLIESVNPDKFVFIGDLINKGPDSDLVVGFVRSLSNLSNVEVVLVRGNHEDKYLRGQKPIGAETLSEKNLEFIQNSTMYYRFTVQDRPFLAVHGGIFPAFWREYDILACTKEGMCPDFFIPEEYADYTKKEMKKWRERVSRFMFCRYVDPMGNVITRGQEKADSRFWAETYEGQAGYCFFGHHPFMNGPMQFQRAVGLDTGCVYGGSLTAAIISPGDGGSSVELIGVKALREYCKYEDDTDG